MIAAMLLLAAMASLVAVAGPASAHTCAGSQQSDCGDCTSGQHSHSWPGGSCYSYCELTDPMCFTDDTLSRSFVKVLLASSVTHPNTGIGWYDNAVPPNLCVASLLGVQAPLGGALYYESARTYANAPGFGNAVTTPGLPAIPAPCPAVVQPSCSALSGCAIHVPPVTVSPVARTLIPQDGVVCTHQSSFITCIPTAGAWTLAACPWSSATFTTRDAGGQGTLGGTGLANVLLSQDIDCDVAYANTMTATALLGSGGNPLSSGFDGVPATALVPFGGADDTAYGVQCLTATYTTVDDSVVPPAVGSATEDGVDYELILDLDAPTSWANALAKHVGGTGVGGNLALQGLYDLGGGNDCDF
jgi:hypothetical protein